METEGLYVITRGELIVWQQFISQENPGLFNNQVCDLSSTVYVSFYFAANNDDES